VEELDRLRALEGRDASRVMKDMIRVGRRKEEEGRRKE